MRRVIATLSRAKGRNLLLAGSAKTVALGYVRREAGVPGREVTIGTSKATVVQLPIEEARLSTGVTALEHQRA